MFFKKQRQQAKHPFSQRTRALSLLAITGLMLLAVIGVIRVGSAAHADGPTITINKNIEYQQIEGFGTFGNKLPDYFGNGESDRWNDAFLTYLVGTLGVTMNREAIPASYEATKGQYDTSVMKTQVDFVNALEAKASALGEPQVKIILSIWSPPAWMKQNGSTSDNGKGANQLKDDDQTRQDFADYVTHYLNDFKNATGFYPYAVSLQNEPQLSLSYDSCYYYGPQLAHLLAVVGPALKNAGIPTKIFYPEDVSDLGHLSDYLTNAEQDATAKQFIGAFAVHGYGANGVDPAADDKNFWTSIYNLSAQYNLPNWMTETSGYDTTKWSAAQQLGVDILSALKYGHLSAWVWWTNTDWDNPAEGLLGNDGSPTWRSEVSQQFYRYIRPGAVMIDANSSDSSVLSVAFNDSANHTLTSVLINNSSSDKTVSLNFQGNNLPSQYTAYRTSSSEAVVNVGTVTNSVTLPANTVTTITGTFSGNDNLQQPPTIVTQPQSQTVSAGQQVTLSVQVGGAVPFTYQWYRNGVAIAGQNGAQYSFTTTSADNGAQYTVTVSNAYGSTTSNAATITLGAFTGATIVYTSTAPTGNSDAIWSTAPSYSLTKSEGSPNNGFSGSFQAAWDNSNLYVLVHLTDSNYTKDSDAIEIYLDGNNDKGAAYDANDWQTALNQSAYSMTIYQNGTQVNPPTFPNYAQFGGSNGYDQLVKIPWNDLAQTPSAGGLVGLDVAIIQGSTNSKTFWNAASNDDWHNPSLFGTGQLSNGSGGGTPNPTPTPNPTATPTPNPTATPTPNPTATPTPTSTPVSGGSLPSPWQNQDIGSVSAAGSAAYSNGTFTVAGSGSDIGGTADSFQYAYQSLSGDGTIVAHVASMDYPNGYARAGVMVRESLNANSAFDYVALTACCGYVTEARTGTGSSSSWNPTGSGNVPGWVKLTRSGNTFTTYVSSDGSNWTQVDTQTITMASNVYIGLAVTSYSNGLLEHSTFDNVNVTHP